MNSSYLPSKKLIFFVKGQAVHGRNECWCERFLMHNSWNIWAPTAPCKLCYVVWWMLPSFEEKCLRSAVQQNSILHDFFGCRPPRVNIVGWTMTYYVLLLISRLMCHSNDTKTITCSPMLLNKIKLTCGCATDCRYTIPNTQEVCGLPVRHGSLNIHKCGRKRSLTW